MLQGLGGTLLYPQVISSIVTIFPPPRGRAFGLFNPIAGPVAAVAHLEWCWIFLVNVPIGILATILVLTFAPPLRSGRRPRLDLVGAALVTAALAGVVSGLIEGERYGWGTVAPVIAAGAVFLVGFVVWQHRQHD